MISQAKRIGIVAITLLLATGDTTAALDAFAELHRGLVEGEWVLERAQFHFFAGMAGDSIDNVLARSPAGISVESYSSSLWNLKAREADRRERTERLLLFQQTAAQDVGARLLDDSEAVAATGTRFTLESSGQTYLVSLLDQARDGDGVWGSEPGGELGFEFGHPGALADPAAAERGREGLFLFGAQPRAGDGDGLRRGRGRGAVVVAAHSCSASPKR